MLSQVVTVQGRMFDMFFFICLHQGPRQMLHMFFNRGQLVTMPQVVINLNCEIQATKQIKISIPGQCKFYIARVPSTVHIHISLCGLWKQDRNFSIESGIPSTLLNTVGVSICLLLFHSLGSVCDNSSFFMGFKAIIKRVKKN